MLLTNDGTLPLLGAGRPTPARVAVIGPNAQRPEALMGCYSFANHVLAHHPGMELGFEIPSVLEALTAELAGSQVDFAEGCSVEGEDRSGFDAAVELARRARTSRCSSSATRRDSSAAGRSARATTPSRSPCPACSASSSRPSWPPARPSSW